ncbi:MAG TPA: hypothetical protein VGW33_01805 [Terriglobia bacterium]|nr:hypothetical protein [Terriglobia bacterium]
MKAILQERRDFGTTAAGVAGAFLLVSSLSLAAQKAAPQANLTANEASQAEIDAARGSLDRFLDSHPEIGNDVRPNPSTMGSPDYVHEHPALQAFLDAHPLVKADPRAFISPEEDSNYRGGYKEMDDVFSYVVPFLVFVCALFAVLWVVRTVLENRRWNRSFKVQEEVHTKLLEKFASGQDLAAYMDSEAGKRLLQWTPAASSSMPAAAGRIMWSFQAGLVLTLLGIGLFAARTQVALGFPGQISNGGETLAVCGVLGMALGVGFILSALISYGLSKHLGLIVAGKAGNAAAGSLPANR